MKKTYLSVAAFSMAIAVILGAMGAHALESLLSADQLDSYKTAVRYQVWHSLAIFIVMIIPSGFISDKARSRVALFFAGGIVLFSFSIYLLALKSVLHIESIAAVLGPITPLGGVLLISGWVILGVSLQRSKSVI